LFFSLKKSKVEDFSLQELRTFCMANLPDYMMPDKFLQLEEVVTTSTHKVDYQALINKV